MFPPSRLSLRFIIGKNLEAHTIVICPTGFVYGSKIYPTLYKLLKDFEQNPRSVPSYNWKSEIEVRRFKWITQKKPWGDDLGIDKFMRDVPLLEDRMKWLSLRADLVESAAKKKNNNSLNIY